MAQIEREIDGGLVADNRPDAGAGRTDERCCPFNLD
jgi:hypothetical protein